MEDNKLEILCNNIERSKEAKRFEGHRGVSVESVKMYVRQGCYSCSGGSEMEESCFCYSTTQVVDKASLGGRRWLN